jgi:uncharacterized protein HI_1422
MTNSNLIAVFNGTIANQSVQLCNARDLHAFLESKSQYANWIKDRINEYGFIQDEDYLVITERTNGRPRKEYHITLDMGKELGMVERNEQGRQIRKYFIECERRATQPKQPALPEPEKTYTVTLTEYELQTVAWACFAFRRNNNLLHELYSPLAAIGSKFAVEARDNAVEYRNTLRRFNEVVKRITVDIEADPETNWRVLKHIRSFNEKIFGKVETTI